MDECNNLCKHTQEHCSYCKENYDVSTEEYKARRTVDDNYVYGYLIKDKQGNVQGILNKATHYAELAWIKENTIEQICSI